MRTSSAARRLAAGLAVVAAGCGPDFSLPAAVEITCDTSADCPDGYTCHDILLRCLTTSSNDSDAPDVIAASVSIVEDRVGPSARSMITFEVTEALAADPVLQLRDPGGVLPDVTDLDAQVASRDGQTYSLSYGPSGAEAEQTWQVIAQLIDNAGNVNGSAPVGPIDLDYTFPDILGVLVVNGALATSGTVTLDVTADEALGSPPAVTLEWPGGAQAPRTMTEGVHNPGGNTYQYTYTAAGDETAADSETNVIVAFQMMDIAGNTTLRRRDDLVRFDRRVPAVATTAGAVLTPGPGNILPRVFHVTNGTTYQVDFSGDGDLSAVTITLVSGMGTRVAVDPMDVSGAGSDWSFTVDLDPMTSYDQGAYTIELDLTDAAGNQAVVTAPGFDPQPPLVIDTIPPPPPNVDVADSVIYERIPWGSNATGGLPHFELRGAAGAIGACDPSFPVPASAALCPLQGTPTGAACGAVFTYFTLNAVPVTFLGCGDSNADGSVDAFDLAPVDASIAYVVTVDPAGNVSDGDAMTPGNQGLAVRDGVWVASFGGKIGGSIVPNPHGLLSTSIFKTTLGQNAFRAAEPPGAPLGQQVGLADGTALTTVGDRGWELVETTATKPPARSQHATTYDPVAGKMILFGGVDDIGERQDTWEWNGTAWERKVILGPRPSRRARHSMAFDSLRQRAVLFGGQAGSNAPLDDTWEWDGERWFDVTPITPSPPGRVDTTMAFDPGLGRVVLFGGDDGGGTALGDTWQWDGQQWSDVTPMAGSPSPRFGHAMAYHPQLGAAGGIVVFGGVNSVSAQPGLWLWESGGWTFFMANPVSPAVNGMAYHAGRDTLVLVGRDLMGTARTWEFFNNSWTNTLPDVLPPPRQYGAVHYDVARGRVVVYAGEDASQTCSGVDTGSLNRCDDIWEWLPRSPAPLSGGDSVWIDVTPTSFTVGERNRHATAYHDDSGLTILFGGNQPTTPDDRDVTWAWTPGKWAVINPLGDPGPYAGLRPAMSYDPASGLVVLFGGLGPSNCDPNSMVLTNHVCQETWGWNGANWSCLIGPANAGGRPIPSSGCAFAGSTVPPARFGHAMVPSTIPGASGVLMFGGGRGGGGNCPGSPDDVCQDTWLWSGGSWIDHSGGPQPPRRQNHAMAYDQRHQQVILFGGQDATGAPYGDTWAWRDACGGPCWEQLAPAESPSARSDIRSVYDVSRRRVVLFGGTPMAPATFNDTWEFESQSEEWKRIDSTVINPPGRFSMGLTYDALREKIVLNAGNDDFGRARDTWELDASPEQRPAAVGSVDFRFALVNRVDVVGVDVLAYGGGRGYATADMGYGARGDGAELRLWRPTELRWDTVDDNMQPLPIGTPSAASELTYSAPDALTASRLVTGDDRLHFAVLSRLPIGNGPDGDGDGFIDVPIVELDYAEVTVRYRR